MRVRALFRLDPGALETLERAGARIGTRLGDIVTAELPLAAVVRLAADPAIHYIEAAARLKPARSPAAPVRPGPFDLSAVPLPPAALDRAVLDAGIDRLRQLSRGEFIGLTGRGVIIGIYDSGLDLEHADFLTADGRTRVLWAWDQSAPFGPAPGQVGPHTFDYGLECGPADIDARTCPLTDRVGHGTHVAGIAAGDGSATTPGLAPFRYTGVAPLADLIVVKGGDNEYTTDRMIDGVAYIFERAAALGRPAVVNVSLGSQQGPHDGTTLVEQALDRLVGPGRLLVVAAGNDGVNRNESPAVASVPIHATATLLPGEQATHTLDVPVYTPRPDTVDDGAVLELWYDGRDSLEVTVLSPRGHTVRAATGDSVLVETPDGTIFIDNASAGPEATNGDHVALVVVFDATPDVPPASGIWQLVVRATAGQGSGTHHLWLAGSTLNGPVESAALAGDWSNSHVVASPGSASRAITVAAFANRHTWLTSGGAEASFPIVEPLGDIAFFSSPGPRRDGVLKPEITAPGKVVLSARSRSADTWRDLGFLVADDTVHAGLFGTSMAAPHVTGALALLLQLRPALTPEDARALLAAGARVDRFVQQGGYSPGSNGVPNAQWGFGKLDVARTVHALGLPPGSLRLDVQPLPPAAEADSRRGTRLELLRLRLEADTLEAVAVERLAFDATGRDAAARFLLVHDLGGDGRAGPAEPVLAEHTARLDGGAPVRVVLDGIVVPAGHVVDAILAIELSGDVPNVSSFSATWVPDELHTVGTLSGTADRFVAPGAPVASAVRATGLLATGEVVNLSENPVHGGSLVVNYAERPRAVTVYTLAGRRVRRLEGAALEAGRTVWDLRNDGGAEVAAGVYLLVLEFPGGPVLRKVMVLR